MSSKDTIDFIYRLNHQGVKFWLEGERLQMTVPKGTTVSESDREWIKFHKNDFIDVLARNRVFSQKYRCLVLKDEREKCPLSFGQERLYFIEQFEEGTHAYNIPLFFKVKSGEPFDLQSFRKSIQALVNRHEVLRTCIKEDQDGKLYQHVTDENEMPDLVRELIVETEGDLNHALGTEVTTVFDLNRDYPIRILVCSFGTDVFLSIVVHHIAFDGWSADIFLRELEAYYFHFTDGRTLNLPELTIRYRDFSFWQRTYLMGDRLKEESNYWKKVWEGYENLGLIPDKSRPKQYNYSGKDIPFSIDREQSDKLRGLAKELKVSVHALLLAAYFLMLRAYTHQNDLVIGTPFLNRHFSQIENLIGFFVNSLPMRIQIDPLKLVTDYIQFVGRETIEAQLHQDLPFEKIVEELNVPKDTGAHPIFQVMFGVQSFGKTEAMQLFDKYEPSDELYEIAKFDLSTFIDDSGPELTGVFNYATEIFTSSTVSGFLKTFLKIVKQFVQLATNPELQQSLRIADVTYLEEEDYERMIERWNDTGRDPLPEKHVIEWFEEQVSRSPDAIAVVCDGDQLTYQELSRRVNEVARVLYHLYAIGREDLVVLIQERNIYYLISVLAVFKVGAAFVPIDPSMPEERIRSIIEECQAKMVIVDNQHQAIAERFHPYFSYSLTIESLPDAPEEAVLRFYAPHAVAYVIYTSGSTGKPKGAMIEYEGMMNHLIAKIESFAIGQHDAVAQIASQSFDVSVWQLVAALLVGGRVVIFTGETAWNPEPLLRICCREGITIVETVPSHMYEILSEIASFPHRSTHSLHTLRWLILNGEALPAAMCERWFEFYPDIPIMNAYGATEASDDSCHYPILSMEGQLHKVMPVGGLIRNSTMYVLDDFLNPLPVGAVGEIYLGGIGVGRGYFNRPDLTAERYIPNPFKGKSIRERNHPNDCERIYKIGDLGRFLPDGSVEFCGRVDFQVKIRGQRVELDEIEKVMLELPSIKQVVVVARKRSEGIGESKGDHEKYLVAYYLSDDKIDEEEILQELSLKLPEHMVPRVLMRLNAFPLTISGKLDRKALPEPIIKETKHYAPPKDDIECQLCQIWGEVLGIDAKNVGIYDDFFRLGGDSIVSIQLVNRVRQRLGLNLAIKDVFNYRTIAQIRHHILPISEVKIEQRGGEQGLLLGTFPLTPIQEWFFNQHFPKPHHWNQSFLICVPEMSVDKLVESLKALVIHHDALRLHFPKVLEQSNGRCQSYASVEDIFSHGDVVKTIDVSTLTDDALQGKFTEWQSEFSIETGPLFVVSYLHGYPEKQCKLFFAFHHLIVDAVSWRIIIEDLKLLFDGQSLVPKGTSYRQWSKKIGDYPTDNLKENSYWSEVQSDFEDGPFDISKKFQVTKQVNCSEAVLNAELTEKLLRVCSSAYHTQLMDLLLSALAYTVSDLTQMKINYVLLEGHGRDQWSQDIDLSRTVGWFTALYPFRLEATDEIGRTIKMTKESRNKIPNHGMGYGALYRYAKERNLPKIVFNYLGQMHSSSRDKQYSENWQFLWENGGMSIDSSNLSVGLVTLNGMIYDGTLRFDVSSRIEGLSADILAQQFIARLTEVISHTISQDRSYLTPSDVDFLVSQDYLDKIQNEANVEAVYLANSLQQGFVYHALHVNEDDDAYRVQLLWQYRQEIDEKSLRSAWELAQQRFEVLRLRLAWEEEIVQIVDEKGTLDWRFVDLSMYPLQVQEDKIHEIQLNDRKQPYLLNRGPLFRIYLIKQDRALYTLMFCNHHAILDGWSNQVLIKTVHENYLQLIQGRQPLLERDQLYRKAQVHLHHHRQESLRYWRGQLASQTEPCLIIPRLMSRRNRTRVETAISSKELALSIGGDLNKRIKQLCQNGGVTINVILQYAWHKTLHLMTRLEQTIIGTTVSGRNLPIDSIDQAVGLFINTLPLIVDYLDVTPSILEEIQNIQRSIIEINTYSHINLASLQKGGEQLFDTLFIFENYPVSENSNQQHSLDFVFIRAIEKIDYPLVVMAYDAQETIEVIWKFDDRVMTLDAIQQLKKTFEHLLKQIIHNPAAAFGHLNFVTPEETVELTTQSSLIPKGYEDETIHGLFEKQVVQHPDTIALICQDARWNYQKLNDVANHLSSEILGRVNLQPDQCVVVCMERSEWLIVVLLAILKAGGAYVPVDPNYPSARIAHIIDETQAVLIITDRPTECETLSMHSGCAILDVGACKRSILEISSINSEQSKVKVTANHLANVIYTSGSTGKPKGVMIEHRSIIATLLAFKERYFSNVNRLNTYSMTNVVFDIFGLEYALPLITGGTLTISLQPVIEALDCSDFQFIQMTPSLCDANLEQLLCTEHLVLLVGGEALPESLLKRILDKRICCINVYGPTETTIWSTAMLYDPSRCEEYRDISSTIEVKIGKPLAGEEVYVLDDSLRLLPPFAIGELYIGGIGLARGYIKHEDLTREKFLLNPYRTSTEPLGFYKTGDLVRRGSDGSLEFLGRKDHQIKLRGHRIELGEIESAIEQYKQIKQAVVALKRDLRGNDYLVGYYQTSEGINEKDLRDFLIQILPSHMIPSYFMRMEKFPLTVSAKIDRNQLPNVLSDDKVTLPDAEPRNPLEMNIRSIWQEVLGLENQPISIYDDFFYLGGNSILAIRLINKVNKRYLTHYKLADLFVHRTIESFVSQMDLSREGPQVILKLNDTDQMSKLFMVHPGGGGCEVYLPLAKKLESQFSCYGVDYYNLYHEEKLETIEKIARFYLSEIDKLSQSSFDEEIYLLGWSLGGHIALEMAYQLERRGYQRIRVFVLDTILTDDFLESLGSYEDLERRKKMFAEYALAQGYNQTYVDQVKANIQMESALGMQQVSGILQFTEVVLFKAMNEDRTIAEIMTQHEAINRHIRNLKYNNVERVVADQRQLILHEVENSDHGSILEELSFLATRMGKIDRV